MTTSASTEPAVFRFAPSPNGYLHLGHAASAIINQTIARRVGGRFLVRIEDIDVGRSRDEFVCGIYDDLRWLGIAWEEPVLRQSRHFADYDAVALRLSDMGLLYPCFASRGEINAASAEMRCGLDPDGTRIYPGLHRDLDPLEVHRRKTAGEPFAMRLNMTRALAMLAARGPSVLTYRETDLHGVCGAPTPVAPERWGDVILQRKDVPTSYHLSVVVDDARQRVSHVVRGMDLQPATAIHRLLQVLLDLPEPVYHHHGLVCDALGRKLSKSEAATSLRSLREAGMTPAEVLARLGLIEAL